MTSSCSSLRALLFAFASCCPLALGAQVNPPTFDPDSVATRAPLKVTLNCPIPDASIYVTLDGMDPTTRDTELDPGSTILLDEPCTLKARVVLADGSSSAVKTGVYTLLPVKGLAATFVEQEAPAVMSVGQAMDAEVVCRNLGTTRWEAGQFSLVPRRAKDAAIWGVSKVPLTETVAMWKTATFSFRLTAPSEPGTYNFQWLLQDAEGKSFGEPTAVVRIRVVPSSQQSAETKSTPESSNQLHVTRAGKADPGLIPGTRSRRETTASEVRWAKVQRFAAEHGVKPGSNLHSLVRALSLSPHSFKALRKRGFTQSDSEFERIIADHPGLFRNTRIIRRDENGKRIIPGWPAIALRL